MPQEIRDGAITNLRRAAQGGLSGLACQRAREALAELGERQEFPATPATSGLESELLGLTGSRWLGDVEYRDVHRFCAERQWSPEAHALFNRWIGGDVDRLGAVLKLHLKMHHESRMTAKFMLQNLGKPWPNDWVNREALEKFVQDGPECQDARTVVEEFLKMGTLEHLPCPPRACSCRRLEEAINRAHREGDPQILIDEISERQAA